MLSSDSSNEFLVESAARKPAAVVERYLRYKAVVQHIAAQTTIELEITKRACQPEQPRFVTKVIRELASSGWLVDDETHESVYRWNRSRGEFLPERWIDEKVFGSQIAHSPTEDRPRERLLRLGASELKTAELVAILIRSGRPGESAVDAGEKIAKRFQDRLGELPAAGRGELKEITSAVEVTAYCQIMAGIELGRRVAEATAEKRPVRIRSSSEAIEFCERHFHRLTVDAKQEEFHIVTLDTKNQVIDSHQITVGTLDASLVHPREVFRPAIKDAASTILLVHNHPSGDATPSREDFAVTTRLEQTGKVIGIDILDHIVLGAFNSVSIREHRVQ
jgi:DNA repair protein RadC